MMTTQTEQHGNDGVMERIQQTEFLQAFNSLFTEITSENGDFSRLFRLTSCRQMKYHVFKV